MHRLVQTAVLHTVLLTLMGCTGYTSTYQERLRADLPGNRELTFSEQVRYRGKVLCGRFTGLDAGGFAMRSDRFIVTPELVITRPSDEEQAVFCSDDPESAMKTRLGIGTGDDDWIKYGEIVADMNAINAAILRYYNSKHMAPGTLAALLDGDFGVTTLSLTDPWGGAYLYVPGLSGRTLPSYELATLGADGKAGGAGLDADISKEQVEMLAYVLGRRGR